MINRVVLVGRLTRDPELKYTTKGTAVTSFSLAVNRKFNKDEVDFFNLVAWQKTAEIIAQYTNKGSQVAIDGRLQQRRYKNKDGQNVNVVEVIADSVQFLDSKPKQDDFDSGQGEDLPW